MAETTPAGISALGARGAGTGLPSPASTASGGTHPPVAGARERGFRAELLWARGAPGVPARLRRRGRALAAAGEDRLPALPDTAARELRLQRPGLAARSLAPPRAPLPSPLNPARSKGHSAPKPCPTPPTTRSRRRSASALPLARSRPRLVPAPSSPQVGATPGWLLWRMLACPAFCPGRYLG